MGDVSRKRWSAPTLLALGVGQDNDGRYTIPTAAGVLRYADDGRKPKMLAANGSTRELWPAPEDIGGDALVVVEGEPDAISALELGLHAVALPGAGKFDERWPARLVTGRRRIYLIGDCDSTGRIRMRSIAEKITKLGGAAYIVDLAPERDDGYDLGDLLVDEYERAAEIIDTAMAQAVPFVLEAPPAKPASGKGDRRPEIVNLGEIVPTQQKYLWHPYLPLGKVVIVAGAPGHGKSQFASLMAGMASRGSFWPTSVAEPSRVLMLCAEDDLSSTVVPRLYAVNADVRMIETINVVTEYPSGLTAKGLIRLPADAELIHDWVRGAAGARLIVLDPVASFFERSYSTLFNQDIRDALGPLVAIAEAYGVTVVVILHLNKSESKDFANRIAESHGFQALARSVMALGPDPDDPQRERGSQKVIALTKANLVKPGNYSMRCEVRSVTLSQFAPPIETSELALLGKCEVSLDDLLLSASERTTRIEASEWLTEFIGDGWRKVDDVRKASTSDGWSWPVMSRLARAKGYQREKQSGVEHGPWWLGAPKADPRLIPGAVSLGPLDPREPRGTNGTKGQEDQGTHEFEHRARPLGDSLDLDEFRRWEQRRLGERDDDDA